MPLDAARQTPLDAAVYQLSVAQAQLQVQITVQGQPRGPDVGGQPPGVVLARLTATQWSEGC